MGGITDLLATCEEAYRVGKQKGGDDSTSVVSIHDLSAEECNQCLLEQHNLPTKKKVTKFRLLALWKQLLGILVEKDVDAFTSHKKILKRGYRVSLDGSIDEKEDVHIETLLLLLYQTAQYATEDDSTECRFVTLLEILLSYSCTDWEPSDDVSRLWMRLMQRIPYQCAPTNFRRKAYRVLVSLSWVPSSPGLLQACSIEERPNDPLYLPKASETWRSAIKENTLIPRHDSVNQLLDRLKDETDVCVAITSARPGMGKSTLASQVVSHPSIRKSFHVVWIRLSNEEQHEENENEDDLEEDDGMVHNMSASTSSRPLRGITFRAYCDYITQLQDQINEQNQGADGGSDNDGSHQQSFQISFPKCERRFEEPALRRLRERRAIEETKRQVAKALYGRNLLLVLEGVTSDDQINLFRFHDKQSLVVTTTVPDLKSVDWTVPLEPFCSQEAVDLFLQQAGLPPGHPIGKTRELAAVLASEDYCNHVPLLIRTIARWCRLKSVTSGPKQALLEVLGEIHSLPTGAAAVPDDDSAESETDHPSTRFLFDILSLMMGPARRNDSHHATSAVFVVCLSAMAVVFPAPQRVPLDVVLLLFEMILIVEPLAADELSAACNHGNDESSDVGALERRRYVGLIVEGLLHMGVVEIYEVDEGEGPWIEIHHELYSEFALAMAEVLDLGDSFEQTVQEWHNAFVTAYFEHRIQSGTSELASKNSLTYAVKNLPSHIFEADIKEMAETILSDKRFFESRVDILGWEKAMEFHILDCMELQSGIDDDSIGVTSDVLVVSPVFSITASMIASFIDGEDGESSKSKTRSAELLNVSTALYRMAFSLAEHGYFEESLAQFEAAQKYTPDSVELKSSILYGMAWVFLVSGESKKALRQVIACIKLLRTIENDHPLYMEARQLHIDILYERCEYKKAENYLREIELELLEDEENNRIELGTVLKKKGTILQVTDRSKEGIQAFTKSIESKQAAEELSYGLASCFCQLGDLHLEQNAISAAKESFEKAIATLTAIRCDPEHVNFLLATGKSLFLRNDFANGFASLELARSAVSVTPLYLMDQSAQDLRSVARIFQARGRLAEAIAVFEESLSLTEHRPNSLERGVCLLEVGMCYLEFDRIESGLECLQESLSIKVLKLGKSIQVAQIMTTIGQVHCMIGDYDKALEEYSNASEIFKEVAPDDSERIALLLFAEGDAKSDRGDPEGSYNAFKKAMDLLCKDHAADDVMVAKAHHHMGCALFSWNRLSEARGHLQTAVSIRSKKSDEKALGDSLHSLGVVLRRVGEFSSGETRLAEALSIRKGLADSNDLVAQTRFELANIYRIGSEDPDKALKIYEDCLNLLETGAVLRGDVYQAMGHAKFFGRKKDEALLFYRRARDIRQTAFGNKHFKTTYSIRAIGLTQLVFKVREGALKTLAELEQTCSQAVSAGAFDNARAKKDFLLASTLIGDAYAVNDQEQEAKAAWMKAQDIGNEVANMGEADHPAPEIVRMYERRLEGQTNCFDHDEAQSLLPLLFVDD